MGLSGGSSTTKPVYSKEIEGAAKVVTDNYNANKGAVSDIAGQVQGLLPGAIAKYQQGNPVLNATNAYGTAVLRGDYLGANPYIDQVVNSTNRGVTDKVQASLGTRGLTGGSANTDILARALAENESGLRLNAYEAERARQQQIASLAPGLAAADYAGIAPTLAIAESGAQLPFSAANNYAATIGGLLGQYTNTRTSQPFFSTLAGLGGSALSGWASGGFR